MKTNINRFLVFMVIVAVLAAGGVSLKNDAEVKANRNVEIVLDYQDIAHLQNTTGYSREEILIMAREWGATSLGVGEKPLSRLCSEGKASMLTGEDLIRNHRLSLQMAPWWDKEEVDPRATYILTEDSQVFNQLKSHLSTKLHDSFTGHQVEEDLYVLEVDTELMYLRDLPVGVDNHELEKIKSLGYNVVPRVENSYLLTEEALVNTFKEFEDLSRESTVIYRGEEPAGFPDWQEKMAGSIEEAGFSLGVTEYHVLQPWLHDIARRAGYPVVYAHSNYPTERASSIINSTVERRVRLLYLNLPSRYPEKNYLEQYESLVSSVAEGVEEAGYQRGKASPIPVHPTPWYMTFLMYMGVVSGGVLLKEAFLSLSSRFKMLLLVLGAGLGFVVLLLTGEARQLQFLQLVTFIGALVFPSLAVIGQMVNPFFGYPSGETGLENTEQLTPNIFLRSVWMFIKTSVISLAGGIIIFGLLNIPPLLYGLSLFRGVKLAFLLPLFIIGVAVLLRYWESQKRKKMTFKLWLQNINELLQQPLLGGYLIVMAGAVVLGIIYIGRTGHTVGTFAPEIEEILRERLVLVPEIEVKLREWLGEVLVIRPRIKEFMLGHPLTLLALVMAFKGDNKKWILPLFIAGAMAQISLVNTFCHLVNPFYVSLWRTFNGLWIGALLGLVLAWLYNKFRQLKKKDLRP